MRREIADCKKYQIGLLVLPLRNYEDRRRVR